MQTAMPRTDNITRGAVLMVLASAFFCAAGCLVKCGESIGVHKLVFFRFAIGIALIVAAAMSGRVKLTLVSRKLLFLRGLLGGAAVYVTFVSISRLGLGKGMVLICSYPVFAAVIGAVFLRERLRLLDIGAILTAILGIYLIAYERQQGFSLLVFGKYELFAVFGAVIAGVTVVLIRKLHDTDDSLAIYFAQCAVGIWLVVVPALRTSTNVGLTGASMLLALGLSSTVGQLLMTEGFRHVPAKTGSLLLMLEPVLCCMVGAVVFAEPLTWFCLLGSAMVIGSCAVVLARKRRPA
jgi:drug/metabolite transporter (DMT)-like permease